MTQYNQRERIQKELCEVLTRIGALKFGMFTLANGKLTPYYIDLRILPSFPESFARVEKFYHHLATSDLDLEEVKRIAGIPTAGIPFASVLAFSLNKPFLYVRSETTHGRGRRVEGILNPGDNVLLVDDLITTGKTTLAAADAIRSEGGLVKDALVLIDRQEGGKAALEAQGIHLHRVILISEAAKILFDLSVIDKDQLKAILKQIIL